MRVMPWTAFVASVGAFLHFTAMEARGSQAKVRIAPGGNEQGKRPVLTFCYEDNNIYDPQVSRVRVARVDGDRTTAYEIAAVGDAWLWKAWLVGSAPRGFKLVQGDSLTAGIYEIYVDAFVGDGVLRVSIDDQGGMRSLPWDKFDTGYDKKCPPVERTSPRIIPKADSGQEGVLHKRAREMRERRSRGRK